MQGVDSSSPQAELRARWGVAWRSALQEPPPPGIETASSIPDLRHPSSAPMSIPRDVLSPQPEPPAKSNSTCLILGLVFGGFSGFVLICGGCCFGTMYFSFGVIEEQARPQITNNAVVVEHIGEVQSCEMDWMASLQRSQQQENTFVFDLTGTKGAGQVVAVLLPDGNNPMSLVSGQLTMSTGEVYELVEGQDLEAVLAGADGDMAAVGDEEFARQVQAALASNAILAERIGEISSFTYDPEASGPEPEDVYVFHLTGAKGSGRLRAECITVNASTESVTSAELTMENGEKVQLFPDKPLP